MAPLIFIFITLVFLAGFLILSGHETKKGTRVFAHARTRLDQHVERVEFIVTHVDLGAFLREEFYSAMRRIAHDGAHISLQAVRTVERLLTRLVRRLRFQRASTALPREHAREFVKTLSDFKDQLKETPPEIPDIY